MFQPASTRICSNSAHTAPMTIPCWKAGNASAGFASSSSACRVSGSGTSPSTFPAASRWAHAQDLNTAKAEFKAAWKALKARTPPEQLAAAYKAMNIRDDG